MNFLTVIAKAMRDGTITAKPCEKCGAVRAVAHHDDYGQPLKVRWLCRKCHALWHRKNAYKGAYPYMKTNQRTFKVYESTHAIASCLSNKFHISMAALVDLLIHEAQNRKTLSLPARDVRFDKINARSISRKLARK